MVRLLLVKPDIFLEISIYHNLIAGLDNLQSEERDEIAKLVGFVVKLT